jgi:hypothetical protein
MALSSSSCSHLVELHSLFTLSVNEAFTEMIYSSMCHLGYLFPLGFHPLSQRAVCLLWQESWKTLPSHLPSLSFLLLSVLTPLLCCNAPFRFLRLLLSLSLPRFFTEVLAQFPLLPIIRSPFHFLLSDRVCELTM